MTDSHAATVNPALVEETAQRYDVGPHYARAYLEYWTRARQRTFDDLDEILAAEDPYPMWFGFAMSTNARAAQLCETLLPLVGEPAGRYLDVGCGFGGYLRAFGQRGMEVHGIEIDRDRIALSRANARDGGLGDCVQELDILAADAPARLGTFDLITCIDVIEHVLDVPGALRRMSELLRPGGTLVLEIPNKDSLAFVKSDGHFNLFGITQLPRDDAIRYHGAFFAFDYDVGDYFSAPYYVEQLAAFGLDARYVDYPAHPARPLSELGALRRGLAGGYRDYRRDVRPVLPRDLRGALRAALRRYLARHAVDRLRLAVRGDEAGFRAKYLTDFWLLVASKPADGIGTAG